MRPPVLLASLLCSAVAASGADLQPAAPAGHLYFEAEEFFSLQPVGDRLPGFLGSGYRAPGDAAPPAVDKTIFLFGNPWDREEYVVWVRAFSGDTADRRVAVEWIGDEAEECSVRLEPTHDRAAAAGFRWQRAGVVKGRRRKFYQLRLHAVADSRPAIDAVLLTADPKISPSESARPCDDPRFTGGDGQGSTRINQHTLVAGSDVSLRMTYSVGESGIREGGALRFFIPESWSPPQATESGAPGHVAAAASRTGVGLTVDCHPPGKGAYAFSNELRHHHECFVRLESGSLQADDAVTVTYTGQVQPYAQSAADFRNEVRAWYTPALPLGVSTDANADGIFWPVAPERSHSVEVIAGGPTQLEVVAPSVIKVGEPLRVKVAALDERRNAAEAYAGQVSLRLVPLEAEEAAGGERLAGLTLPSDNLGHGHTDDVGRIEEPGYYAVLARDEAHGIEGLSNAIRCTAEQRPYRVYWGDLHTHHRRCDGLRTFEEAATHARDVAGLDVLALSPHACYITDGDLADLWQVDERFNEPGRFVTLFAYEWAAAGRGAGHSVIYSRQPLPLCFRAWGGGNVIKGRPAIYQEFDRHGLDVVEVPHHVRGCTDRDPRYQKAIEIYSQWGPHEPGVVANLTDGLKACFFGASDNHTGQPGLQPISNRWAIHHHHCGLTAFMAPRLTRDALFDAIGARRCYATADCRILADFQVNGHAMGEELTLPSPDEPRLVTVEAAASTPIRKVVLLRNGRAVRTWTPEKRVVRLAYEDSEPYGGPTDYYYVRLDCDEGQTAWLTPVWVAFEKPVLSPETIVRDRLDTMPNLALGKPVSTNSRETITYGRPETVTDGKLDDHFGHGIAGHAWVQVDLGEVREIAVLRLWNYFRDGRTYHGNRLALSPTGEFAGEEAVVFDSNHDGEYAETSDGRLFVFGPVRARYIRSWLGSNTANDGAQWIELEAYGPLPELDPGKEPQQNQTN